MTSLSMVKLVKESLGILIGMEGTAQSSNLSKETFDFLLKAMGIRDQFRVNHWQTESYAEHKMTDKFIKDLDEQIDEIGEAALGIWGRPRFEETNLKITDFSVRPTRVLIQELNECLQSLIDVYKETKHESMVSLLGDFSAQVQQYLYLETLKK